MRWEYRQHTLNFSAGGSKIKLQDPSTWRGVSKVDTIDGCLNAVAAEGWELVNFNNHFGGISYVFKRPIA